MIKVLIFDGSFEGFLTSIYEGFYLKSMEIEIHSIYSHVANFLNMEVTIITDEDKASKVYNSVKNKLNGDTLKNLYYLYLYDDNEAFTLGFKYLKLAFKYGSSINLAKNNNIIILVDKFSRRVTLEAHKFTGFVRFTEIGPLTFYSKIEPDNNILPLLVDHFAMRFNDENFIIHDAKRETAIVYNKQEAIIVPFSNSQAEKIIHNSKDEIYSSLWKSFYKSTTIKERLNPRLQRNYMPKRYWKNLNELH